LYRDEVIIFLERSCSSVYTARAVGGDLNESHPRWLSLEFIENHQISPLSTHSEICILHFVFELSS
jgi:hypothetical protein